MYNKRKRERGETITVSEKVSNEEKKEDVQEGGRTGKKSYSVERLSLCQKKSEEGGNVTLRKQAVTCNTKG